MRTLAPDYLETLPKLVSPAPPLGCVDFRERVRLLDVPDQMLLQMVLEEGKPLREVGRLVGCSSGTISRRIRTLHKRLREPLVLALCDKRCPLPQDYRDVGLDYYLRNHTAREIAFDRNLSRFQTMQLIHFMKSWFRGLCATRAFLPK